MDTGRGSEREPLLEHGTTPASTSVASPQNYTSPRRRSLSAAPSGLLLPLPEDAEITIPSLTPKELKDRLIFGSSANLLSLPASATAAAVAADTHARKPSALAPQQPSNKTNLHRSKTAPAMATINDHRHPGADSAAGEPRPGSTYVVRQAVVLLAVYLGFGVVIYSANRRHFTGAQTHPVVDALYFSIVTMCTIGYGDITPATPSTKIFSILFVLIGFGFVDILLSGMVSYVLDLQESLLLAAVKSRTPAGSGARGGHRRMTRSYFVDVKKGRMRIRIKVGLALAVVVLCIGVGAGVMHFVERLDWLDSLYLSVMSVTTVGYGDRAFRTLPGRMFAAIWLLVSTLAVARAFLYLAEARIDKRHRMIAKWVLKRGMTVAEFLAADIDHNGCVSKSEFVIYKLKEMGKISENDILPICNQFDRLDTGNCGKITLNDLLESHH